MTHLLPPLPYAPSALEPHIDARTMTVHHDLHHAGYVEALNVALETAPAALRSKSVEWLLLNLDALPKKIRTAVRRNGGGHLNHSLLWLSMTPDGKAAPAGALGAAIERDFGSLGNFRSQFEGAGARHFGAGWVWLVAAEHAGAKLQIITAPAHYNPIMQGYCPLLVNDLWEHAYYLKHENRRAEYLHDWWPVVDWREVERRFADLLGATRPEQAADTGARQSAVL